MRLEITNYKVRVNGELRTFVDKNLAQMYADQHGVNVRTVPANFSR